MNDIEKLSISEKAHKEYVLGKSYKYISEKYDVPINTLKSWKRRYKWTRDCIPKKGCTKKGLQELRNNLYKEIKEDLLLQLSINETKEKIYIDLVDDYMSLWDIKNRLIQDIRDRGVTVLWENGKQNGYKKNDSISELVKVNTQMLKILNDLNLKPSPKVDDEYDL